MPKSKDINLKEIAVLSKISHGEKSIAKISRELSITIQGVRYYVQNFLESGFITEKVEITSSGIEFLRKNLEWIKNFLMDDIDDLYSGTRWEAISDGQISKGDTVSLYMKEGYLYAKSGSSGTANAIARTYAKPGDIVLLTNLDGIISITPGSIRIYYIPEDKVVQLNQLVSSMREIIKVAQGALIGIIGESARALLNQSEIQPMAEFSALEAAFEAAVRGKDAIVVVSEFRMGFLFESLRHLKLKYKDVKIEIISL
ncbi:MAG: hypothetical protein AMDU2_EPLC00005G0257 [Thermoplasmatales archaeon E-plasma]|jgi:putative transcriptional regulator|nr:MAG: hypothetical protein AMDU2_EPLC00005G0257 [Thermoplasmatales archaeon E-plasma]